MATAINGYKVIGGVPMIALAAFKEIQGYNVRDTFDPENDAADAELFSSVDHNGFQADKPVTFRLVGADPYIIAGHRRFAAVMRHNATCDKARRILYVPAIPEAKAADGTVRDAAAMALDLLLSNNGKPLSPAEKGAAFLRMQAGGVKNADIALRAGVSEKWIRECIKMTRLDSRLKALVKAGTIPPTMAAELTGAHGPTVAATIAEEAAKSAPTAGAKKGKVTAAGLAAAEVAVTGKPAKVAAAPKLPGAGVAVTVVPAKVTTPAPKAGWLDCLAGPFRAGKGDDDCEIQDATGDCLAEAQDADQCRAMVRLLNQGWQTFKGTPAPASVANASVAKAGVAKASVAKPAKAATAKAATV